MKTLKKLFCFLLIFAFCFSFSACTKGGNTGGGGDKNIEQNDDNKNGDNKPEEYVPLNSSDIILLGADMSQKFLTDFSSDLTDSDKFDDNIEKHKILFLNASQMLKKINDIKNLSFEVGVKGEMIEQAQENKPNMVNKFYINYIPEDANGNASVEIKIIFSFKDLSVENTYDYYYFLIETNKKQGTISFECAVENSSLSGSNDSQASYNVFKFGGAIGETNLVKDYDFSYFERITRITNYSTAMINNNFIKNFEQSTFSDETKKYFDPADSEQSLRNPNSEQVQFLISEIGKIGQSLNLLQLSGAMKTVNGLSNALVVFADGETKII